MGGTKIYTKAGDGGLTHLVGGARVPKDDLRVEAYGTVDELSAQIALLRDMVAEKGVGEGNIRFEASADGEKDDLLAILDTLMYVEASLAGGSPLKEGAAEWLEGRIDAINDTLPALKYFTIPGGSPLISQAHVCRTVCRRAERRAITAQVADTEALKYLNRLSDYLYIYARNLSKMLQIEEIRWENCQY